MMRMTALAELAAGNCSGPGRRMQGRQPLGECIAHSTPGWAGRAERCSRMTPPCRRRRGRWRICRRRPPKQIPDAAGVTLVCRGECATRAGEGEAAVACVCGCLSPPRVWDRVRARRPWAQSRFQRCASPKRDGEAGAIPRRGKRKPNRGRRGRDKLSLADRASLIVRRIAAALARRRLAPPRPCRRQPENSNSTDRNHAWRARTDWAGVRYMSVRRVDTGDRASGNVP